MKNNMENLKKVENVEQLWKDGMAVIVEPIRGMEQEPIVIPFDLDVIARTVASLPLGSDYGFHFIHNQDVEVKKSECARKLAITTFGTFLNRIYFLSTNEEKVPFVQMVSEYQMGEKEIEEIPYMEESQFWSSL